VRFVTRPAELFLKALGLVYLVAFISFGAQADGLVGSQGVLPLENYLRGMHQAMGARAFWYAPTVFWANSSDLVLGIAWIAGAALSIVLTLGFFRRTCLVVLLILYLSICTAGQDFWSFQWDILLLEAGFLAIFLDASPGRRWLFRWLLFRLMFMSGLVKLLSGDPAWRNLTALGYHYETQPLPTPIAWYMFQLPGWFQKASTAVVLFVELPVSLLIFAPARPRRIGACILIGLQVLILLTGNYTFFNLLALALCLFLFEDRPVAPPETSIHRGLTIAVMAFVVVTSGLQFLEMFSFPLPPLALDYLSGISPLRIVNTYGLFAVMTTTRPEIVIEGSRDGDTWLPYEFRYKPGDLRRAPPWVEPYQPRLDWQMWFAALGSPQQNAWFYNLASRLMQGSAPVLRLLANNPFPAGPPRHIRALVYDYQFTDFATRKSSGAWWRRELKATYLAPVSLGAH
jgi:hypothetical protein